MFYLTVLCFSPTLLFPLPPSPSLLLCPILDSSLSSFLFFLPSPSVLILYPPLSLPLFLSSLSSSSSSSPPSSSDPNAYSMSKVNLSVGHDPSLRMQNLQLLVVRVKHFYLTYLQQLVISTLPNVSAICHSPDSGKLVGSYPSSFSFPVFHSWQLCWYVLSVLLFSASCVVVYCFLFCCLLLPVLLFVFLHCIHKNMFTCVCQFPIFYDSHSTLSSLLFASLSLLPSFSPSFPPLSLPPSLPLSLLPSSLCLSLPSSQTTVWMKWSGCLCCYLAVWCSVTARSR